MSTRMATSFDSVHPCQSEPKDGRPCWLYPVRSALAIACAAALLAGCGATGSTATHASTATPASTSGTAAAGLTVVRPRDVIAAPTRIADTAAGPVSYREVGTGSPILLVMGLSGSIDDWQPDFVATLAAGHTVVVFDNAGVGRTAALAAPLSITEMANQASALISTLRLGSPRWWPTGRWMRSIR
jgi:hypothetical protein